MIRRNRITTLVLILFFGIQALSAKAQSGLQSPSEFLGYNLGTRWTPHYKVMDYFRHVAGHSPMAKVEKYGETNEGRELMLAFISSETNMGRLEEIRTNNLKRAGLMDGAPTADSTVIVWLSYNVHGNDSSIGFWLR